MAGETCEFEQTFSFSPLPSKKLSFLQDKDTLALFMKWWTFNFTFTYKLAPSSVSCCVVHLLVVWPSNGCVCSFQVHAGEDCSSVLQLWPELLPLQQREVCTGKIHQNNWKWCLILLSPIVIDVFLPFFPPLTLEKQMQSVFLERIWIVLLRKTKLMKLMKSNNYWLSVLIKCLHVLNHI